MYFLSGATAFSAQVGRSEIFWPVIFSNVRCRGRESMLINCPHESDFATCSHPEASGIGCQECKFHHYYLFQVYCFNRMAVVTGFHVLAVQI